LAERLALEEGAEVRVLLRDWRKATWISRADVELVQGDITNRDALLQAMRGCEIVFHCAAAFGSPDECMHTNVEGTRNVLECADVLSVKRLVYLSSVAVHGPTPPDNADEQDEFRPLGNGYADSKIAAEELIWRFHQRSSLPVAVIRAAPVWGPRGESFTVWPLRQMSAGEWFLVDRGRGTCNAVYIDNLVDALLLAGIRDTAIGQAFLITDDQPCSWEDFFGHYKRMLGIRALPSRSRFVTRMALMLTARIDRLLEYLRHTPEREPARTAVRGFRFGLRILRSVPGRCAIFSPWDIDKYAHQGRLNVSKARRLLGYQPRFTLQAGMRDTEMWLRDQRLI
jgi:nucleoside-diphosphate-sugar epimerase